MEAVQRAVELAPKIKEELGLAWLEQSFTKHPERGMDILATIGGLVSQGMQTQPMNLDYRLQELKLQKTAVEALLKAAPERGTGWRPALTLLAAGWLREAEFTYQFAQGSGAARMRRDRWGNIFFMGDDDGMPMQMHQHAISSDVSSRRDRITKTRATTVLKYGVEIFG